MHRTQRFLALPLLLFSPLAVSLPTSTFSYHIVRDDYTFGEITDPNVWPQQPLDLKLSIQDLTLHIDVSAKNSKLGALLALEPGKNSTSVDVTGGISWHNDGDVAEFQLGDWDVSGVLKIDKGITAKTEFWGHIGWDVSLIGPCLKGWAEAIHMLTILVCHPATTQHCSRTGVNLQRPRSPQ